MKTINEQDLKALQNNLKRVNSSEVDFLDECLIKDNVIEYKIFDNGIYILEKDDQGLSIIFTFDEVVRNYEIATYLEDKIKQAIRLLDKSQRLYVGHDQKQIYLNQFLFKKDFNKPHYGLEYEILKLPERVVLDSNIEVKSFDESMLTAIAEVQNAAFKEQDIRAGEKEGTIESMIKFLSGLFNDMTNKEFYSYWKNDDLVGYAFYDNSLLEYFVISPKYQNQGYGTMLLKDSLFKYFNKTTFTRINLNTYLINLKAQRLYEKCGFIKCADWAMNIYKKAN